MALFTSTLKQVLINHYEGGFKIDEKVYKVDTNKRRMLHFENWLQPNKIAIAVLPEEKF
jgi:hypothetical protein